MMQLEHLNLVVKNLPDTLTFYQAAFPHWQVRGGGEALWYGKPRNWLHFGDDYQYLTFNDNGTGENRDLTGMSLGLCHFAFVTHNLAAVIQRLNRAGYVVDKSGDNLAHRHNVYFIDPNGYEVEFVEYRSDLPAQRNYYQANDK